jgi:hypothetical protein
MKKFFLFSLLLLALVACKKETETVAPYFSTDRLYIHAFFETEEECARNQPYPDFWINCDQRVWFYKNGNVELMVTDIINRGTYRIKNNQIILTMEESEDIGKEVVFTLISDHLLVREDDKSEWKLE